uniref:Uncharacterized protein n=1 Tax=Chromera velia CCMP2878 TaxID=1169474 RepID=A0A0G4GTH3_9ALVE|eukprot:Cvel_5184.t1-p1 / transcript=Cvel_5184.t1 / gene=Cvel_5184 / organism=Chromera_velia_CCMP2878 / gene_product=Clathrin heavy chain 1, putative / transcript_product=Clathrin heavy chain 1, putative / location=Cvel_scaffold238:49034-51298(+) / protein_length=196 / sequence_SO=supercontig / SO=protein_coding / is_pseudo=false
MSDKGQIRKLLYTRDRGSLQVKDARRELTSFKRSQPPPHPPCFVLLRRKEGADVSLQTFYHAWETHQATNCTRTSEKWTAATPSDCYNYTKDAVDALHRAHNGFCEAKLPDPRSLFHCCDLQGFVAEVAESLLKNQLLKCIEVSMVKLNPQKASLVICTLIDLYGLRRGSHQEPSRPSRQGQGGVSRAASQTGGGN